MKFRVNPFVFILPGSDVTFSYGLHFYHEDLLISLTFDRGTITSPQVQTFFSLCETDASEGQGRSENLDMADSVEQTTWLMQLELDIMWELYL